MKYFFIVCFTFSLILTLASCDKASKDHTKASAKTVEDSDKLATRKNQAPDILSSDLIELGQGFSGPLPIFISDNNNDELKVSLSGDDAQYFQIKGVAIFFADNFNSAKTEFVFSVTAKDDEVTISKQQQVRLSGKPASKKYAQLFGSAEFSETKRFIKACLPANKELKHNERFYKDYIQLLAKPIDAEEYDVQNTFSVHTAKKSFCLTSLKFAHQYVINIKKGFPFENAITKEDISIEINTPDQSPSISFSKTAFILPPTSEAMLPIELTNVSNFEVLVVRLSVEQLKAELANDSFNYKSYFGDIEHLLGESQLIGREKVSVSLERNKATTMNLDLSRIIESNPVGSYTVIIVPDEKEINLRYWDDLILQKVVYTDVGLVTYRPNEGLYVYTMSYRLGEPLQKISVDLVANNSEVLATEISNRHGMVFFADPLMQGKGGMAPQQVRAINEKEFAFVDFNLNQLDLTQHNIAGNTALKPINAFVTTERGVYRNNEDVYITTILRDNQKRSISPNGIRLEIVKPDGNVVLSEVNTPSENGMLQTVYKVPKNERTGQWTVNLYYGEDTPRIGQTKFEVADYIPQTISVDLNVAQNNYDNKKLLVAIKSDYLYGAPASNLQVEGTVTFSKNRRLFNQFPDFLFGDDSQRYSKTLPLAQKALDENGILEMPIGANLLPKSLAHQPITASIRMGVEEDSGRINYKTTRLTALEGGAWVGVKSEDDNPSYSVNKVIDFELINLDINGLAVQANTLTYNIIEEEREYHWYSSGGDWKYRVETFDKDIVDYGSVKTDQDGKAKIPFSDTNWGYYRLEIEDSKSQNRTSLAFSVGYSSNTESLSSPEKVGISTNKGRFNVGDTMELNVTAPYTGKLHLVVANTEILLDKWIDLTNVSQQIPLKIEEKWGDQFYITAMVFRPHSNAHGPARAVGVEHVFVEQAQAQSNIELKVASKIRPNGPINIAIESSLKEGGEVVVMAVDKGILNLTGFKTPNPYEAFYAKQALNLSIHDLYQHLIQYKKGEVLKTSFGGDANVSVDSTLRENIFNPTVLVSSPVKVDKDGRANVTFNVPQFNGQLQIMAIGVDETKIGSSEAKTVVASPITVASLMPRFAHINDRLTVGINLHNLEIPEANIQIDWQVSEGISILSADSSATLIEGEKQHVLLDVQANSVGAQNITANIKVNGKDYESHTYNLNVENLRPDFYLSQAIVLNPQEITKFTPDIDDVDIRHVSASLSMAPVLNVEHYIHQLRRYPLGCLDQTSSKAWGYLSSNNAISEHTKSSLLKESIIHLGTMQQTDGGFSAWPEGNETQQWLSLYATDLMLNIHKAFKDEIPNTLLAPALEFANGINGSDISLKAYAQYIIASAQPQLVDKGEVRYLTSLVLNGQETPTVQTLAFLILSNDKLGYKGYVQSLYKLLQNLPNESGWSRAEYSSELKAKILRAFVVSESTTLDTAQKETLSIRIQDVKEALTKKAWISTHEKAWLMRLFASTNQDQQLWQNPSIMLNDKTLSKTDLQSRIINKDQEIEIENKLDAPVFLSLSYDGTSQIPLSASNNELQLSTQYFAIDGRTAIDISHIEQGTEVLVKHRIRIVSNSDAEISLDAPVPAGFEVENPKLSGLRALQANLAKTDPTFEEFRDARYLAAWTLPFGKKDLDDGIIHVNYIMRAVSRGSFVKPAIVVEDMYRPTIRANSAEGTVVIE